MQLQAHVHVTNVLYSIELNTYMLARLHVSEVGVCVRVHGAGLVVH